MTDKEVLAELPKPAEVVEKANYVMEYWRERNRYIADCRKALEGKNKIEVPEDTQYKAVAVHTYFLSSVLNEKTARFLDMPVPQFIPNDPLDTEEREKGTRIEQALRAIFYEMERNGDADVWSRLVADAILLDGAVERIERAPAAWWPELVEDDGTYPLESPMRDKYKQEHGVPIRTLYVPLENAYPIYDGAIPIENFEFELRSVSSCRRNKLFNQAALVGFPEGVRNELETKVTIIHHSDARFHAYYAVVPGSTANNNGNPYSYKLDAESMASVNECNLLYAYEHGIGELIYNFVGGRFGGWKTSNNRIEAVNKGFLELSQAADELFSQAMTGIRATEWPSLLFEVDPESRGYTPGDPPPKAPSIKEGQEITVFKGENLRPIIPGVNNSRIPWAMETITSQLNRLGGSTALFGENQPGVDTGYHNAQQISQAEHLDEKIEQHLVTAAINRVTKVLLHAREINEKVWCHHKEMDTKSGTKSGKFVYLDPKDLKPLPRFDIAVRRPRSIDIMTNIRAAREATDDRNGKGPLYSDQTVMATILGLDYPDLEVKQITIEGEKKKLLETGIISDKIAQGINLKLAQQNVPAIDPSQLAGVDPALLAAQNQVAGPAAAQGGLDPALLAQQPPQQGAPQQQNPLNRSGGMLPGDPQMEARVGDAINGAMGRR